VAADQHVGLRALDSQTARFQNQAKRPEVGGQAGRSGSPVWTLQGQGPFNRRIAGFIHLLCPEGTRFSERGAYSSCRERKKENLAEPAHPLM
jgi:hypothetical protein